MAFNQSEISLLRGKRGGKILVTAAVGSSGEGLTEKIQFFFRSNGNKILAAIQRSEINYWICKILSGVMF